MGGKLGKEEGGKRREVKEEMRFCFLFLHDLINLKAEEVENEHLIPSLL